MSLQASKPTAPQGDDDPELRVLAALRRLTGKIRLQRPGGHRSQSPAAAADPVSMRLENDRGFFESHLLRILSEYDLEDEYTRLIPLDAQLLRDKLGDLCYLLNEVANEDIQCIPEGVPRLGRGIRASVKYVRLEKVLLRAEQSVGPLELATGSTESLFRLDTAATALGAHSVVKGFGWVLNKVLCRASRGRDASIARESQKRQGASHGWLHTFDRSYRSHLGGILDRIHVDFSECIAPVAGSSNPKHKVFLRLLDLESLSQPVSNLRPSLLLYCPKSGDWQNTECRVHSHDWLPPARLCQLVGDSLRRGDGLDLGFSNVHQTFTRNLDTVPPLENDPRRYPKLSALVNDCRAFDLPAAKKQRQWVFTYRERRILAVQLALDLLICCNWHHSSTPWDGDEVYFSGSSLRDFEKERPYLSYFTGPGSPHDTHVPPDDEAPMPSFTKFARVLLELEYGPLPPGDFGPENDYGYRHIKEFYQSKRDFGDLSREPYLKAVEACLQFDRLLSIERSRPLARLQTDEETRRRLIREKILASILQDLQPPAQPPRKRSRRTQTTSTEEDRSQGTDSDSGAEERFGGRCHVQNAERRPLRLRKKLRFRDHPAPGIMIAEHPCLRPQEATDERAPGARLKRSEKETANSTVTSEREPQRMAVPAAVNNMSNSATMFDSVTLHSRPGTATSAMHWFQLLDQRVYPIVAKRRRAGDRAVKIAVLDTGIDATHERIQSHLDRHGSKIIDCRDWTTSQHETDDRVGHGTAVCDVLLRTAKVHLYVGKVVDETAFDENVPARVAQAISHAAAPDGWNVDIIVLSLGFENEDKGIRNAIYDASNKNVVILAAASNNGSIDSAKRMAFPARIHGRVIAIRSATGFGRRAESSPGRSDSDDNFAILGEGIEAAWPRRLNDDRPTRFVSGTSYATPLAAGVVALMMEFAIQKDKGGPNLKKNALDILMSYRGVRKMFEYMSATPDNSVNVDCRIILPWNLFDPEMAYEGLAHVIDRQLKKAS